MDDRESIERLKKWGLNGLQARVYLAMGATYGGSKVRQISKLAGVNRAETYKVLSDLEAFGLIELQLGRPKLYRLCDPKEVLPTLLTKKKKELQGLELEMDKTAEWIASRPKVNSQHSHPSGEMSTVVLGGSREAILNRVAEEWKRAESEIVSIIGSENLMLMLEPFFKNFVGDLHRRGVSFRIMTEITSETAKQIRLIEEFAEVRHSPVDLEFDIVDGSTLLLLLSKKVVSSQEPLLLTTTDHAFVDTMSGLFCKLWDHSIPANIMLAVPSSENNRGVVSLDAKLGQITEFKRTRLAELIASEAIRALVGRSGRELQEVTSGICIACLSKTGEEHFITLDDFYAAHQRGNTGLSRVEGRSILLGKGFFAIAHCPCPIEARATADQEIATAICEMHRELVRGYANKVTIGSRRLRAILSPKPNGVAWRFEAGDDPSDMKVKRLRQLSEYYGCVAAFA